MAERVQEILSGVTYQSGLLDICHRFCEDTGPDHGEISLYLLSGRTRLIYHASGAPDTHDRRQAAQRCTEAATAVEMSNGTLFPLVSNRVAIGAAYVRSKTPLTTALLQRLADALYGANIYRLAVRDDLTRLHNRRYFLTRLREELSRHESRPLGLLLLDIDHFKYYNDAYGHPVGDRILSAVASLIGRVPGGLSARFGGEEFVALLPGVERAAALATARSLCNSIAGHDFSTPDFNLRLTVSIGIALYPGHARDAAGLIRAADEALYRAKESGRNRVCFR